MPWDSLAKIGTQYFVDFDTEAQYEDQEGRIGWSQTEDTLAVGMPGGQVVQQVGMELYVPRRVKNQSGSDMLNGQLVYISSGSGNNVYVELAQADARTTAETTIAMLTEDVDDNGDGFAATFGLVRGTESQPIDTSSYSAGDELFLDASTAGAFTGTLPVHPNYMVRIGQVFRSHATEGAILVNIEQPVCACKIAGGDDAVWDDLRFPATAIRQGATTKPDFDTTNIGLLFPQNDADEIAYIVAQFPHAWLLESGIRPHIHFVQDSATTPTFKMDYRWYKNGEDPTGSFTTITANSFAFTYTSGTILQIASFPEIDGTGIDTVSSIMDIKLYRDDNDVSGDVLVKEFDIHYQTDSLGSRQEFIKG